METTTISPSPGWWLASDGQWYPPPPPVERTCMACGGKLIPRETAITRPRRVKFGLGWVFATFMTGGFALVAYLIWPREDEVIGVDRFVSCWSCGTRQA